MFIALLATETIVNWKLHIFLKPPHYIFIKLNKSVLFASVEWSRMIVLSAAVNISPTS